MDRILRGLRAVALAFVAAAVAACASYPGTSGYPGGAYPGNSYPGNSYPGGSYPGGSYPGGSPGGSYGNQIVGTVQGIDVNGGRLMLSTDPGYGGGERVEVYFDNNTQLYYQGQQQSVAGLEAGDRIRVDAASSNGRLWARTIEVVQDVRATGGYGGSPGSGYGNPNSGYGNELHGAITGVDPQGAVLYLTSGGYSGAPMTVHYDGNTQVEYQGQVFRPDQLESGDVVRIQARQWNGAWLAERVWVEVNARSR